MKQHPEQPKPGKTTNSNDQTTNITARKAVVQCFLNKFWNPIRNRLILTGHAPLVRPFVLGLVAQKLIIAAKDIIDPALAAKIVMEAAVPLANLTLQAFIKRTLNETLLVGSVHQEDNAFHTSIKW